MRLSACRGGPHGRDFLMRLFICSVYHPVEGHGVDELVSVCQGVGARMLADVLCEPCGCIANLSCVRVLIRRSGTGAPSVTGASIAARTLVLHKHHYWYYSAAFCMGIVASAASQRRYTMYRSCVVACALISTGLPLASALCEQQGGSSGRCTLGHYYDGYDDDDD